jgi:hypothetical protein
VTEASEKIKKSLSKSYVHEAVRDRIAARRRERQQLEEADCGVAKILIHCLWIEQTYCVDNVQRRPTDKKLQDNYEEHLI